MEKVIAGTGGRYKVSPSGTVSVLRKGIWREPAPRVDSDGRLSVMVEYDGVTSWKRVHLLVAEHFLEGTRGSKAVHINGDVTDNRVENLRWANRSTSGMTAKDVQDARREYNTGGITQTALAGRYGVTPMTIHNIITRKTWKHI